MSPPGNKSIASAQADTSVTYSVAIVNVTQPVAAYVTTYVADVVTTHTAQEGTNLGRLLTRSQNVSCWVAMEKKEKWETVIWFYLSILSTEIARSSLLVMIMLHNVVTFLLLSCCLDCIFLLNVFFALLLTATSLRRVIVAAWGAVDVLLNWALNWQDPRAWRTCMCDDSSNIHYARTQQAGRNSVITAYGIAIVSRNWRH